MTRRLRYAKPGEYRKPVLLLRFLPLLILIFICASYRFFGSMFQFFAWQIIATCNIKDSQRVIYKCSSKTLSIAYWIAGSKLTNSMKKQKRTSSCCKEQCVHTQVITTSQCEIFISNEKLHPVIALSLVASYLQKRNSVRPNCTPGLTGQDSNNLTFQARSIKCFTVNINK